MGFWEGDRRSNPQIDDFRGRNKRLGPLGTSHGIGAARAMQVHPDAGAYAGLALGLQVVLAALLMPLLATFISRWFGG